MSNKYLSDKSRILNHYLEYRVSRCATTYLYCEFGFMTDWSSNYWFFSWCRFKKKTCVLARKDASLCKGKSIVKNAIPCCVYEPSWMHKSYGPMYNDFGSWVKNIILPERHILSLWPVLNKNTYPLILKPLPDKSISSMKNWFKNSLIHLGFF